MIYELKILFEDKIKLVGKQEMMDWSKFHNRKKRNENTEIFQKIAIVHDMRWAGRIAKILKIFGRILGKLET